MPPVKPEQTPERRPSAGKRFLASLGPVLVALLLATAAFFPSLRTDRQLAGRDLVTIYYPLFRHMARAYQGKVNPERDPYRGAGLPLIPDPLAQACYPPAALRACFPFDQGFKLWFLLHTAWAGIGAALLARRLGASMRGACLAAAVGTLAGPILANVRCPNLLAGTAWAGFALAGFVGQRAPGGRGRRHMLLAAVSVAFMILAGGIEILMLLGLAIAVAVPFWEALRPGEMLRSYLRIAISTLLGALLSASHLVPCLFWLPETHRGASSVDPILAGKWALDPGRLLEMVVPVLSTGTSRSWARLFDLEPFGSPLNASIYLGLPVVLLAMVGVRHGRSRGLAAAVILWLLLAMRLGESAPLFHLLREVPLFDNWRYPAKTLLPLSLVVASLAGLGLKRLTRTQQVWAYGISVTLALLCPLLDRQIIPTLPLEFFQQPPALAQSILQEEASRSGPPGRYLRLRREDPAGSEATFEDIRNRQRALLRENLPSLYGIEGLAAYTPFRNRRLDPYLLSIRSEPPEYFDRARLAEDACVAHVLDEAGLHTRQIPSRVRLISGRGRARLSFRSADRLEVEVELQQDGVLYLAEAYQPGWRAQVVGSHPVAASQGGVLPIEEARGLFMGISLPAGRYKVVLTYHTPGLWLGVALTAVGLLLFYPLLTGSRPPRQSESKASATGSTDAAAEDTATGSTDAAAEDTTS